MAKTLKQQRINRFLPAFTLVELTIVVIVIGLLAGLVSLSAASIQKSSRDTARDANVKILSTALEKYYRKNGEYPSVALMTSQDVATLKQKLGVVSASTFKLPLADDATKNSIVTSSPSPTRLLYSANTTNSTKNTQCQTSLTGYCDGYQLQYQKESDNSIVIAKSLHDTFTPVAGTATCAAGETQSGNTCTKTYAATYQSGTYSCPSGGTLSGTTCTNTYAATYHAAYYYCHYGETMNGSGSSATCTYPGTAQVCPSSSYSVQNIGGTNYCMKSLGTANTSSQCPSGTNYSYLNTNGTYNCYDRQPTGTYYWCNESGATLSGSTCTHPAVYSGSYYDCPSGGSLSGSTCTNTYTATQSSGYYYCADGGTLSGTTCTYTYTLP
ncbi:hypothetical protein RAAC3_TM7C00001G0001 [Candidatus Saccharibacteria bacterium RAAC3_TM7_1]|nr:hypothetical protein RAAC3_TM7C00001G0001 [Candidatus Saccharibacteria bacterium RAAC3_TM7_1]